MTFARRAGTVIVALVVAPMGLCGCNAAPAGGLEPQSGTGPEGGAVRGTASASGSGSGLGSGLGSARASNDPSAFPVDHEAWAKLGFRLDWVGFPFPRQGRAPKVVSLVGYDDVVVAQESDSTVTVLEAATGQRRWATDLTGPLTRFVSLNRDPLDPNRVILTSESEAFVLAIPNGNLLGRERFDRVVNTRGVLDGSMLIYGTSSGEVLAHRLGVGVKAWGFGTNDPIDAAPVLVGSTVLTVNQGGEVLALGTDGKLAGRNRIFGGTATDPVSNGTLAFVAGLDQSLWAFDESAGLAWRYRTPGPLRTQPAVFGDRIYVEIRDLGLTALATADGTVVWSSKGVAGTVISARGGELLVWDDDTETLTLIGAERGAVLTTAKVPGVEQLFTDGVETSPIYAVSDKGVVARFVRRK